MKGLFISYRREDSAPYAGRLCDNLRRTFPSTSVFIDVDAVDPGADFVTAIDKTLSKSRVVLAVIGPRWGNITDNDGCRRIERPDDYVVRELSAALQSEAHVIPVLVGGAAMPQTTSLPPPLRDLSRRNAVEISDTRFAEDVERLFLVISRTLGVPMDEKAPTRRIEHRRFLSDDALSKIGTRFRYSLWICYALTMVIMIATAGSAEKTGEYERVESRNLMDMMPPQMLNKMSDQQVVALKAYFEAATSIERQISSIPTPSSIRMTRIIISLIKIIIISAFLVWVNIKLIRGKSWARACFVVCGIVTISAGDSPLNNSTLTNLVLSALYIAALISYGWTIQMMYTEPIKRWFLRA